MTKNTALVLCLDQNRKIIREDSGIGVVYYEYEAMKCVDSWREHGGPYADIPIYLFNFRKDLNPELIRYFLGLTGVFVVDAYKIYPEDVERPLFVNTLLAQSLAERLQFIREDFLVYTDLDMNLSDKPYLENLDNRVKIGEYTNTAGMTPELAYRFESMSKMNSPVHNTYFMAYDKRIGFFQKLEILLNGKDYRKFFTENIKYEDDDYFFEEGLYDFNYIINGKDFGFRYDVVGQDVLDEVFEHRHMRQSEIFKYMQALRKPKHV